MLVEDFYISPERGIQDYCDTNKIPQHRINKRLKKTLIKNRLETLYNIFEAL